MAFSIRDRLQLRFSWPSYWCECNWTSLCNRWHFGYRVVFLKYFGRDGSAPQQLQQSPAGVHAKSKTTRSSPAISGNSSASKTVKPNKQPWWNRRTFHREEPIRLQKTLRRDVAACCATREPGNATESAKVGSPEEIVFPLPTTSKSSPRALYRANG